MIVSKFEPVTPGLLVELGPLLRAACAEVHGRQLQLDTLHYLQLAAAGRYALWVARDSASIEEPVGLCGMILATHQHLGCLSASQDLLYLAPSHRKGDAGLQLLRQVDRELLDLGCVIVYRAAPAGTALGSLYERAGYGLSEITFERELG